MIDATIIEWVYSADSEAAAAAAAAAAAVACVASVECKRNMAAIDLMDGRGGGMMMMMMMIIIMAGK